MRQAEAVSQDDELHVVQVGAGSEHARVQVLQHGPHAALARVREHHLWDTVVCGEVALGKGHSAPRN